MTQTQIVSSLIDGAKRTIAEIAEITGIKRPNIRRILGQGALKGEFTRIAKGVYTLRKEDGKHVAWVECGDAVEVLQEMVEAGAKYDMIVLDPPYKSSALRGGNRLQKDKWYELMDATDFEKVMKSVSSLVSNDETHVYLMLSGARTAQSDMQKYLNGALNNGFRVVSEGSYKKTYKDGKPVINIRGEIAAGERIILLNKLGFTTAEVQLDFTLPRPSVKEGYRTEKPGAMLKKLIEQSTKVGDRIADFFAGSGVTGEEALKIGRRVTLIDKSIQAVEDYIMPRLQALFKSHERAPHKLELTSS